MWQWLGRIVRAEASEVGLVSVASALPKFDAAPPPIGGRFITTKPDVSGSIGSPDVHSVVMPALTPRAAPVRADDSALLRVHEAYIETLKAENESLKRQLAAAEARAERLTVRAAERERCPWWCRRLGSPDDRATGPQARRHHGLARSAAKAD